MPDQEALANELWLNYKSNDDAYSKNKLIEIYAPYVKYIARRVYEKLPPNVEFDDLVSYGTFGLMDAISKFDPSKNVKFKTYAGVRIHGAIIDCLREQNWVPRSVVQKSKELERAKSTLNSRLSREANDEELAEEMGITIQDLRKTYSEIRRSQVTSTDDIFFDDDNRNSTRGDFIEDKTVSNPLEVAEKSEIKELLVDAISSLSEREKLVISLYYFEELTLKEIGKVLSVSDSRVSQLHTKAVNRLKEKLKNFKEEILYD
ncbi:MAG: FliA/WhiG family RNA polymerase sigma factor [Candidatus Muirbacterium halophilum]|nr:FliA/WhiG family RNA polymerase sigma factor [Candidatus Muirbacterium halophilum]MCK9474784.1 FliA/WhiG family RNA polymerase sigma factor [Candidatus Muirbacterium halophilum]